MRVNKIKTEKKFKEFKVELTFQDVQEVNILISLLSATAVEWNPSEPSFSPYFEELKEILIKAI
tara:strand:+ start:42 stop:233 length:192 start_codon:yes stop_codon:yes gene_type:complete